MRRILLTFVAMAGLCVWSMAWASPQTSWGQNGYPSQSVQITNGPTVQNVTPNSAVVSWTTNTGSSAVVHYGTDPNNLTQTAQAPWSNGVHTVTLTNLQPGTTYYFQVESGQGQGTGTGQMSSIGQFQTPTQNMGYGGYGYPNQRYGYSNQGYGYSSTGANQGYPSSANQAGQSAQITQGPVVESVSGNSAVIAWSTNAPASSVVMYGTSPNNLTQTAQAPWGEGGQTTHRVTLTGLQPNTTYYYQVQSGQSQGTGTGVQSNIGSFRTPAQ